MTIKETLEKHKIDVSYAEYICLIVKDLLNSYVAELRENEQTAFYTIRQNEEAAEIVHNLGLTLATEYDEMNYCDDDEDDSNLGCKDCPDDECTGHCMSCYYRS